ncbi:MAG: methyltransferase domain-containing protein [Candidatus Taylorbacteria bacterium]|nr:methyltransferase domain-containing protein [Candidatus Taylorbacteria bacterium]
MFTSPESNIEQFDVYAGLHVADIGAGSGFYTLALARKVGELGRVYAVDVQRDLLERIRNQAKAARLENVEIILGDAEKRGGTKLSDASVERAILSNVLFQADDHDALVEEVKRILKPGGRLLLVDWTAGGVGGVGPKSGAVPRSDALKLFEKHGFSLEGEIGAGDYHYGLILRKK